MTSQKRNKNINKSAGFTIVEVGLVLAIAALIFLSVFLVIPAFQRNARDNAVKDDVAMVANAVSKFYANDPSNVLGGTTDEINEQINQLKGYMDGFSSENDNLKILNTCTTTTHSPGGIFQDGVGYGDIAICSGYRCKSDGVTNTNDSGDIIEEAGERSAAIVTRLNSGDSERSSTDGKAQGYCQSVGEN